MRLDPAVRGYKDHLDTIFNSVNGASSRLYLDTSSLMWLVKVGRLARAEFIAWCLSLPKGAVRVPVWAAHEFGHHIREKTASRDISELTSEIGSKIDDFVRLAATCSDDLSCRRSGFSDRAHFMNKVRLAAESFKQFARAVSPDEKNMAAATEEVIDFINPLILKSDTQKILREVAPLGTFRYSHRVPPGYLDGGKAENKFGDLVFWEEVIADLGADGTRSWADSGLDTAVIVTADDKTDWVVEGLQIVDLSDAWKKPNRDVGLDTAKAHPMLLHEMRLRTGLTNLQVVHPAVLAIALDVGGRTHQGASTVRNWLSAAYPPVQLGKLPTEVAHAKEPAKPPQVNMADVGVPPCFAACQYDASGFALLNVVERGQELERLVVSTPPTTAGLMGLGVAIAKGAALFDDILESVAQIAGVILGRHGREHANIFVLSALIGTFFADDGRPLRRPKSKLARSLLLQGKDSEFGPALAQLSVLMQSGGAHLPYFPGQQRKRLEVKVVTREQVGQKEKFHVISEIRLDKKLIARHLDERPEKPLRNEIGGADGLVAAADITNFIAGEFLVPIEMLTEVPDRKFKVDEMVAVASLDCSVEGGVEAIDEFGGGDD